ncbi:MAG TPA: transporter substrate-binding domain-containing protein [Bordetella sp.]
MPTRLLKTPYRYFAHLLSLACLLTAGLASASPADDAARQALAPSGVLRVGLYRGSPTSIIENAASHESRGVAYDLGRQLAAALGVPCETVVYPANAPLLKALASSEVDVVFTNATAERARHMDFSPVFMSVEKSLLVPGGSSLKTLQDAKRPGLRVGVSQGSSTSEELLALYPGMSTQPIDTLQHAAQMLASGQIDAFGTNDAILYQMSDGVPGSRVLPGHWGTETFAAGIPKGRQAGMPFLRGFMAAAEADGSVAHAVARADLRGVLPGSAH